MGFGDARIRSRSHERTQTGFSFRLLCSRLPVRLLCSPHPAVTATPPLPMRPPSVWSVEGLHAEDFRVTTGFTGPDEGGQDMKCGGHQPIILRFGTEGLRAGEGLGLIVLSLGRGLRGRNLLAGDDRNQGVLDLVNREEDDDECGGVAPHEGDRGPEVPDRL